MPSHRLPFLFALPLLMSVTGCGATKDNSEDPVPLDDTGASGDSTSGDGTPTDGPVGFDVGDDGGLSDGFDPDGGCAKTSAKATKVPVDIIIVIDQSGSMGSESVQVSSNLNNLAKLLDATKLDYRVVMIAGQTGSFPMCVPAPLGDACSGAKMPKFRASNRHIESWDALTLTIATYESTSPTEKWSDFLRKDAFKIFIPITDDDARQATSPGESTVLYSGPGTVGAAWDTYWLSKGAGTTCGVGCFGTKTKRKYAMYPILGANKCGTLGGCTTKDIGTAYPYSLTKCTSAVNTGPEYLSVLALTKAGQAFSVCEADYKPVFDAIGKAIIQTVSCEILIPPPPAGEVFDPTKVNVEMTQGVPPVTTEILQDTSADCAAGANGWQYNSDKTKILLCGDACTKAKSDPTTVIDVIFGCGTHVK